MAQTVAPELFERFKEGLECWNHDELDLMQDMYVEDAVFDVSGVFPDVAPMRGHKQMRRYWNEMRETWDGIRQDPLDAFDLGDGRYVVDVRWWGTGRRTASRSISGSRCSTPSVRKTERLSAHSSFPTWRQRCRERGRRPLRLPERGRQPDRAHPDVEC